jgi:hypothetical protein
MAFEASFQLYKKFYLFIFILYNKGGSHRLVAIQTQEMTAQTAILQNTHTHTKKKSSVKNNYTTTILQKLNT